MQDLELVTRCRSALNQEQPLTQSEADDEFDALLETQTWDQWTMELPTLRSQMGSRALVARVVGSRVPKSGLRQEES